jgi:hypothetical protein
MKMFWRVNAKIYVFLTTTLVGGEWSASRPCRLTGGRKSAHYSLDRASEPIWTIWRSEHSSPYLQLNYDPSVVQSIAILQRHTDSASAAVSRTIPTKFVFYIHLGITTGALDTHLVNSWSYPDKTNYLRINSHL